MDHCWWLTPGCHLDLKGKGSEKENQVSVAIRKDRFHDKAV